MFLFVFPLESCWLLYQIKGGKGPDLIDTGIFLFLKHTNFLIECVDFFISSIAYLTVGITKK